LLLCLFFMMVSTCPVRSLLSSASFSTERTFQQPSSTNAFVDNNLSCPFEGRITQATLLDLSKLNNNSSPIIFIPTLINLYLFVSILNTGRDFLKEYRDLSFLYSVPLFLKNRSIII